MSRDNVHYNSNGDGTESYSRSVPKGEVKITRNEGESGNVHLTQYFDNNGNFQSGHFTNTETGERFGNKEAAPAVQASIWTVLTTPAED